MSILINIDVPDLAAAETFYCSAFALKAARRFGTGAVELLGWNAPVYLLQHESGTIGAAAALRSYTRHWTPVHIDVVVPDLRIALSQTTRAGAKLEGEVRDEIWGKIATMTDPFGHGFA